MSFHDDIRLYVTRACSCGARLEVESTPPTKALHEERRWLGEHAGPGHVPVAPPVGSAR